MTLVPIADASVSRKGGDENCGDSKRLYVANDGGGEGQSLLPFDLALITKSFGPFIGFRKMARGDWMGRGVAWDDVAGDDGTKDDKPTISFVDNFEGGACRGRGHTERGHAERGHAERVPGVGLRFGGGDVEVDGVRRLDGARRRMGRWTTS